MAPNLKCAACCVCGKKRRTHPGVKLHLFPKDARRCLQWVKALKIGFQKHTQAICCDHFDGVHFGSKGQLLPTATPCHTDGHEEQPPTGFPVNTSSHNAAAIDLEPMELELSSTQIVLPHYDLNTGFGNTQENVAAQEESPRKRPRVELNRTQPPPEECGSIQPHLLSVPQATHENELQPDPDECAPHCTAPAPCADFGCETEGVGGNPTRPSSSPKYKTSKLQLLKKMVCRLRRQVR
ncbi:uncharacterized protein LOC126989184 isoform X3 [Eriocheir sinensis]|uniref:uncharacterized protein LOC126989184 isoform X3 n=1 Tax=Eriocheir sinensis TaxID=95602 RepID=UPI0021CABBDA|nr:uncharacterized protein LOC126989184 isoform X3 [Eriocheir sinensis]